MGEGATTSAALEIRPTMKFVGLRYMIVALVELGAAVWWVSRDDTLSLGVLIASFALNVWPVAKHIERQRSRCRLEGSHLRYEHGIFTTTVKTMPVAKIQDVTVHRTLNQRIWGVGNLQIQTAGETSNVEIPNVDDPEAVGQEILEAAAGQAATAR